LKTFSDELGDTKKALAIIDDLFENEGVAGIAGLGDFYLSQGVVMFRRERKSSSKILLLH